MGNDHDAIAVLSGGGAGGAAISAGANSQNTGTVIFSNSNGVTFGLNAGTLTASVNAAGGGLTNIRVSADTYSTYLSALTFNNSGGVSFGMDSNSVITATVATNYQSVGAYLTTAALSGDTTKYAGVGETVGTTSGTDLKMTVDTNGVNISHPQWITTYVNDLTSGRAGVGESSGTVAGTDLNFTMDTNGLSALYPKWITTYVNDLTSGRAGVGESSGTVAGTDVNFTMDTNGLSLLYPKYITTYVNDLTSGRAGVGESSGTVAGTDVNFTMDTNGLSLLYPKYITTYVNDLTSGRAGVGESSGTVAGTDVNFTMDTNGLSLLYPKYITTYVNDLTSGRAGTASSFGGTNISGSMTHDTSGLTLSMSVAAPGAAAENNWVNILGANSAGNTTASGSTLGFSGINMTLSGTNNSVINMSVPATSSLSATGMVSLSTNGSTISVGALSVQGAYGITSSSNGSTMYLYDIFDSSYVNMPGGLVNSATYTFDGASMSQAVAFNLPEQVSFNFLRLPVSMTTQSTTIATSNASRNVSAQIGSTWNAVVYSLGTGANSKSLQYVTSGSNGWTFRNSISITGGGTQYSVSLYFSAQAEGAGTTRTTQYSISNTNYSFTTNQIATEWSGVRWLDIPLSGSLSGGNYWLVLGYSSSSATNSAGNWSNCYVKYSNHYVATNPDLGFGIMGSTNLTSGGLFAGGMFSTAGGGTTNSIPISAISSTASNPKMYFQLLRSA